MFQLNPSPGPEEIHSPFVFQLNPSPGPGGGGTVGQFQKFQIHICEMAQMFNPRQLKKPPAFKS